jgi:hypothetical protein
MRTRPVCGTAFPATRTEVQLKGLLTTAEAQRARPYPEPTEDLTGGPGVALGGREEGQRQCCGTVA